MSLSSRLQIALLGLLVVGTVGFAASLAVVVSERLRILHLGNEVAELRESVSTTRQHAEAERARLRLLDRAVTNDAVERWRATEIAAADREALAVQQTDLERVGRQRDRAVAQRDKALAERDAAWTANLQVLLQLDARTQSTIAEIEGIIASIGLTPARMIRVPATSDRGGPQGGPFVPWPGQPVPAASGIVELRQASSVAHGLERLQALRDILKHLPLASPVAQVEISNGYGFRMDPFTGRAALHEGIDLRSRDSSVVYATAAGTVAFAGWQSEYGYTVDIDHGFGLLTRYAHLSRIDVKAAQPVSLHQPIGLIGATGRATGVHLHYEVRVDGRPRNPVNFLKADRYVPEVDRDVPEANVLFPEKVIRASAGGGSAGFDHR